MTSHLSLTSSIIQGFKNACKQSYDFLNQEYANPRPEYLLTVNVAQQIQKDHEDNYIIRLEESTAVFQSNSVSFDIPFEQFVSFLRKRDLIERQGLIDIALYDEYLKPMCAIEIKNINFKKS